MFGGEFENFDLGSKPQSGFMAGLNEGMDG